VRSAVDVRILVRVERREPVDDRLRLLRRCAVVEPDKAPAVNLLLQDRKIVANRGASNVRVPELAPVKTGAIASDGALAETAVGVAVGAPASRGRR
jgi:hypothetical protein